MLPLKPMSISEPKDQKELCAALASMDANTKLMAGGTDLLPNLKHGLYDVHHIISLRRMSDLHFINVDDTIVRIGALTKLSEVAAHKELNSCAPAIAKAASAIASPQIRNMGTVGGNLCLDTRCLYFNQTQFWRSALGFCLKKDGCACHVVKTGKRCVAAASNDLATALLAYDAHVNVMSADDNYSIKLDDLYTANGEKNNVLPLGHMIADVHFNLTPQTRAGFYKLRMRESIDFPMLSIAVRFVVDEENNLLSGGKVVINALVAKPKIIDLDDFAQQRYNSAVVDDIAALAQKKCHPQTNITGDSGFRKHMIAVAVKRAFHEALETN